MINFIRIKKHTFMPAAAFAFSILALPVLAQDASPSPASGTSTPAATMSTTADTATPPAPTPATPSAPASSSTSVVPPKPDAPIESPTPVTTTSDGKAIQPDNSGVNERDRAKGEPTADKAGQHQSDVEIMQKIRKSVIDDKALSTYAHNVKIISKDGTVTLKGPVRSDEEKASIETKATAVAGSGKVVNELSVKPKN